MNFWSSRRVLVTGGASFIGSHLVERLVASGAAVRVADDLSSGKIENLAAVGNQIEFIQTDLRERASADQAVRGMEAVFHLAASHGGRGYIDTHPAECANNMALDGTVFDACHRAQVDRVCFASSACVYPTTLQIEPRDGNMIYLEESRADPFRVDGAGADGEYGWAKLMGEMSLCAYVREYGLKGVSCRLFTVYGERENESHAVIALIAKAFVKMEPYEIWGTGEQDRNFTYVGDIVEGLMRAAEKITDGSPLNIGTAEHIRIKDCVEMIFEHVHYRPKRLYFDVSKPVGVFSRAADLTRLRTLLNWEPATTFRQGLGRTIDWYYNTHSENAVAEKLELTLTER